MFPVIHIHLGNELPFYFWETVSQTRRFHDGPIYLIGPASTALESKCKELGCTVFDYKQWENVPKIASLKKFSFLDAYDNGKGFWRVTLERLFFLECLMRQEKIEEVLHVENDVTIYFEPEKMLPIFKKTIKNNIAVVPLGPSEGCTAALMFAGSVNALSSVNNKMIELLSEGEQKLKTILGTPMVHEMMLLGIINKKNPCLLNLLPILPEPFTNPPYAPRKCKPWQRPFRNLVDNMFPRKYEWRPVGDVCNNFDSFQSVFDPLTWGQFIDGTHKKPGISKILHDHWIAGDLHKKLWNIKWESDEKDRKIPVVIDKKGTLICKLNNLHIHSKRISNFV